MGSSGPSSVENFERFTHGIVKESQIPGVREVAS
jgi:hypothetical protein